MEIHSSKKTNDKMCLDMLSHTCSMYVLTSDMVAQVHEGGIYGMSMHVFHFVIAVVC